MSRLGPIQRAVLAAALALAVGSAAVWAATGSISGSAADIVSRHFVTMSGRRPTRMCP